LLDQLPVVFYRFTGVDRAWKQRGQLDLWKGLLLEHGETGPAGTFSGSPRNRVVAAGARAYNVNSAVAVRCDSVNPLLQRS
jgi:hypothetical protein